MLNGIFVFLVLVSILLAAFGGGMEALTAAVVGSAKDAVTIALGLVGVMAFFLGLMRVAQDGGLLRSVSRIIGPVMRLIFPSVPRDHPAMSAMILNIASNMFGLGNAATPFGLKAMMELDRLNGDKGTATDAMVLFLAINTAGFAILPSSAIAARAAVSSTDPAGILLPTVFASGCATVVGITAAILFSRLRSYRRTAPPSSAPAPPDSARPEQKAGVDETRRAVPSWAKVVAVLYVLTFAAALAVHVVRSARATPGAGLVRELISYWALPVLIGGIVLAGWARGAKVYACLVEGAKEGFQVAVRIIPYLVAILVMVGMFRASGGMEWLVGNLQGFTRLIGMPAEALPMALLRPLSGSGAYAVMTEIMKTHGPDTPVGYMVSTFQGSTETTFYVLAVYFGAVGVKRTRHALPACLLADAAGILAAVFIVRFLFG